MSARIGATVRSFGAALAALFFSLSVVAQIGGGIMGASGSVNPNLPLTTNNLFTQAAEDSVAAHIGGGKASATALSATKNLHRVSTVASANDSILMPPALAGQAHFVRNDGVAAMQVFGQGTDTINGVATGTGVSHGQAMGVWYVCETTGNWTATPGVGTSTWTGSINPSVGNSFALGNGGVGFEWLSVSTRSINIGDSGSSTALTYPAGVSATLEQRQGTTAQANRLYFSTTGPVYWQQTARTAGVLLTGVGGAAQISIAQTTPPTCTTNCGTPGNVCVGTDTSMICTMGTTPASGVLITFNGTWAAAPSCVVQMALAGMVVGKQVLTAATTTTTITLVTNGTAPVAGDKYAIICLGVS